MARQQTRRQKTLNKRVRARGEGCWLCGEDIDYTLDPGHPKSFSVDHVLPWKHHPELREDPGNLKAAHRECNDRKGERPPPPSLGLRSRQW